MLQIVPHSPLALFFLAGALPEEFLSHTNTSEEVRPVCMVLASSPLVPVVALCM